MSYPDQPKRIQMESYSLRNMYLGVFVVNLLHFSIGATLVWTSPVLPYLKSSLQITEVQAAAVTCSCSIGKILGPGVGTLLVDRYGYRPVMWLNIGLGLTSLLFLTKPSSVLSICVGRLIAGIGVGAVLIQMPAYATEIADPEVHAALKPIFLPIKVLGYLVIYALGPHLSYHQLLLLYLPVPIISLICLLWMPESPYHHVSKGRIDQAKQTITFLRRGISTNAVDLEVQQLQDKVKKELSSKCDWSSLLAEKANIKALYTAASLISLHYLTGATVVLMALQTLLAQSQSRMSVAASVAAVGVTLFLVSAVIPPVTRGFGYNKPLICSSIAMFISMVVLGLYFLNLETGNDISKLSLVPLGCILLYLSASQIGFACNKDEIVGKLFNSQFKTFGISSAVTIGFFFESFVAFMYFPLEELLGTSYLMWIFAAFSFLIVVYVSLCMPETSTMTSKEVQNFFQPPTSIA